MYELQDDGFRFLQLLGGHGCVLVLRSMTSEEEETAFSFFSQKKKFACTAPLMAAQSTAWQQAPRGMR